MVSRLRLTNNNSTTTAESAAPGRGDRHCLALRKHVTALRENETVLVGKELVGVGPKGVPQPSRSLGSAE